MKTIDIVTLDITLVGGIERVISLLANNLAESNKVRIVSVYKKNNSIFYDINSSVEIVYLTQAEFNSSKVFEKISKYYYLFRVMKMYLKSSDSEVIISMFTNINIISAIYGRLFSNFFIATEHAQYTAHNWIIRLLRKIVYPKLDKVVVLNTTDYLKYKTFLGDKVALIPNPLTFETDKCSTLENKIIFSAGRLSDVKGFDLLLKAFVKVVKVYPDWKLIITGDGEERDKLLSLIDELNLSANVELKHFEKNIDRVFLESSIYCLSSRQECFPMILLEAMSFGLPVVSFDVPSGPKDIIQHSIDGFLIDAFDLDQYANKIIELIGNKDLRVQMGKNAKNNIERYSAANLMKKWEEIIRYE